MFRPTIREESFGVIAILPDGSIDLFHKDAKVLFAEKCFTEMRKIALDDSKTIVRQKREGVFRGREFGIPLSVLNQSSILKSPLVIQLELTTLCNLRYKFCFSKAGVPRENELPTSEIKSVIRQLKQEDVSSFFLTGGDIRKQNFAEIWHHGFEKVCELCKWDNFKCCKSCELSRYYCNFRLPVFSFNLHGNYNSCGTPEAQKHLMLECVRLREKTVDVLSPDDAREKDNW